MRVKTRPSSCPPRWATPRRLQHPTQGDVLAQVAEGLGWPLFPWQRQVADVALEHVGGHYRYRTVGVGVGRQNGKTALVASRIAMEALRPKATIAYTAQDRNMARQKWEEHVELLMDSPFRRRIRQVLRRNGGEHVRFTNGATYKIVTPSRRGGRGNTLDLVVIDEALTHDMQVIAALQPTLATRPNGQLWILSNAGDDNSIMLKHYRSVGHGLLDDDDARLAWLEWAPADDKFDHLDPRVWQQAIPSMGQPGGVTLEAVADAAATTDPATFTREWLNVWPAEQAVRVIDLDAWRTLERTDVVIGSQVVLGVDISPERTHAAIGAAGQQGPYTPLEVVDAREGTTWVLDRIVEVATRWSCPVIIDAGSPAASLIPAIEAMDIRVVPIAMRDYGKACGSFYDGVQAGTVVHLSDYRLNDAIAGGTKRPLGDAWAWNRRGDTDITPLVAVTLARWGIVTGHGESGSLNIY